MASVFLSYSREDRPRAQQVVAALEAGGVSVWWDGLIEGGERFSQATEAALDGADVVVVLWSKTSVKSHWVHDEATRGRDRGRLVPASIDGVAPPLGFGQFQALDLSKWKGKVSAPEMAALVRAIGIAAGQPMTDRAPPPPAASGPSRRALILGSGAAALLAGGGFAALKGGLFAPADETNSVAVLPFRNLSGDPGQNYFAEGLAEEIRNTLSRNPLLKVIATTSSAIFRERENSFPEIASKLAVAQVLDGSVRREGETVRIGLQLIDGKSGGTTWTKDFDRKFADLLPMQMEIATAVMQVLNVQVSGRGVGTKEEREKNGGTTNAAAFDAFMRGKAAADNMSSQGLDEAVEYFRKAHTIDPAFAAALSAEANSLLTRSESLDSKADSKRLRNDALSLSVKAKSIAPDAGFVTSTLGRAYLNDFQFANGIGLIKRAHDIAPNDFDVLMAHGRNVAYLGEFAASRSSLEKAKSIDPFNSRPWLTSTWVNLWSDSPDEALKSAEHAWSLNPEFSNRDWLTYFRFSSHYFAGRFEEAKQAAALTRRGWEKEYELALIDARLGNPARGKAWVAGVNPTETEVPDVIYSYVSLQAQLGNFDQALEGLWVMLAQKDPWLITTRVDPFFAPLRSLPAFQTFVRRLGLAR